MTSTLVDKMDFMKSAKTNGYTWTAQGDGVVVLNLSGTLTYQIDTTLGDGQACQFASVAGAHDYATLYSAGKSAFPTEFP